jgi:hypothetical protein
MDANLPQADIEILRRLAERKVQIVADPVNEERRQAWYALDSGSGDRPIILIERNGIRDPRKPCPDDRLECVDEWARGIEMALRDEIYNFEEIRDDHVVEPFFNTGWQVARSGYGVQAVVHRAEDVELMGSKSWDPPIVDLDADFAKLKPRTFSVDREASLERKARLEAVFADIIPVRIRGSHYWTLGLTWQAIELIGLQGLMMAMYDNPDGLHRIMAFMRDDHLAMADWLEEQGLYTLNNENDYIGSGSFGYTRDLPQPDWREGAKVRKKDLWVLSESQETVGVGPDQFEEFVFPYQLAVAGKFGKCYYGCCEPVNNRWHILKRMPNLERVSVSPWADQTFMAEACGRDYVFSRKPNPTLISTATCDETAIREDLRETLAAARECRLEIVMKDVHTLANQPERARRWVEIAREEVGQIT